MPEGRSWPDQEVRAIIADNERLRSALITAAQWMPSPGQEYTEDAKADVKQVQEALGWKLKE